MWTFILKRLAFVVPQVFIIVIGTFLLLRVLPADPVAKIVGLFATPEAYAQAERSLGLHRPLAEQLQSYLGEIWRLDFGRSWTTNEPVWEDIKQRFPVTLQLIVLGFGVAIAISIPLGTLAALRVGSRLEKNVSLYALFAGSQPEYWWGLIFVYIFFVQLGWFPAPLGLLGPGAVPPSGPTGFILIDTLVRGDLGLHIEVLKHLTLPVLTLALVLTGPIIKIMRQSALDVLSSDYVLYARATGRRASDLRMMTLRNALTPALTVTAILFGISLGGAVLIESVFSLQGLGLYAKDSTLNLDFPAIQGVVIVMTTFMLAIYLVLDILYAVLDPRVRVGSA